MLQLTLGDGVVLGTLILGIVGIIFKYIPSKKAVEFPTCQAHSGIVEALKNQSDSLDEIKESFKELFKELRSYYKDV